MIRYTRNFLFRFRKQPITATVARECKRAGILRYRGKRAGRRIDEQPVQETANDPPPRRHSKKGARILREGENPVNAILLNARSLRNKVDELGWLLDIGRVDVAAVTETWLTPEIPDTFISIPNYHIIRTDRTGRVGGGVCFYVHSDWKVDTIEHKIPVPEFLECCTIQMKLPIMPRMTTGIILILMYVPPGLKAQQAKITHEKIALLTEYTSTTYPDARTVLLGDFNQLQIHPIITSTNLTQIVKEPTRSQSKLDLIFTDIATCKAHIGAPLGTSDHATVLFDFDLRQTPQRNTGHKDVMVRPKPIHAINECGARLANYDWSRLESFDDINEMYTYFKETVNDVYEDHFPEETIRKFPRSKPWFTQKISDMIAERTNAYRQGDKTIFSKLRKRVKQEILRAKRQYFANKITRLRYEEPRLWHRKVKDFAGEARREKIDLTVPGDVLNAHFASYGVKRCGMAPKLVEVREDAVMKMEIHETARLLRQINPHKAHPINDCPIFMLKQYWVELAGPITKLYNKSLCEATIPDEWCRVEIIPIPKVKNPKGPDDHRPIGLLPQLMKCLERYVTEIVRKTKRHPTEAHQYGGTAGRSTNHYLIRLLEFIHEAVSAHKPVKIATVDVAKAYNSVNHDCLEECVASLQLHPQIQNWIMVMVFHLTQVVRTPGSRNVSEPVPIVAGLPQGMALAGELFIAYVNDAPSDYPRWMFIDDITTGATDDTPKQTTDALQSQMNSISGWLGGKKLTVNASKSRVMSVSFSACTQDDRDAILTMGGDQVAQTRELKILGVILQDNLKFHEQIDVMAKKTKIKLFFLRRLSNLGVGENELKHVYTTYIRPCLEYAAPVWTSSITAQQRDLLETLQKKACMLISRKWSKPYDELLQELALQNLEQRREKLALTLAWRMFCSAEFRDMFPPKCAETHGMSTRNGNKLYARQYGTTRRYNSPIPYLTRLLNASDLL